MCENMGRYCKKQSKRKFMTQSRRFKSKHANDSQATQKTRRELK